MVANWQIKRIPGAFGIFNEEHKLIGISSSIEGAHNRAEVLVKECMLDPKFNYWYNKVVISQGFIK